MAFRTNKMPVLQEKSASGAVATFNTALAMPLASCSIAVNAWQEGSGDPSPSNVRPIHGFSEVNATANEVIHTIQLGEEVYGAEVDIVNGVAHCTHRKEIFDGTQDIDLVNWRPQANSVGFTIVTSTLGKLPENIRIIADIMSDKLKTVSYDTIFSNDIDSIALFGRLNNAELFFRVSDTSLTTKELVKTWLSNNNIAVVYLLATPFDIQLTPTQIATIRGNNTIFADTGDIDLTYKDLDIAKRGNFREVFKLPS